MKKKKYILFILLAFFAIFILLFLLNRENVPEKELEKYNIYVVYSPVCPHCENLLNFLDKEGIGVEKISIEMFPVMKIFRNLSEYYRGEVPFVFAKINNTIIIIKGYPSKNQENDGYFIGKEFEEDLCKKTNGIPVYINNTYAFCKLSENVLLGNRYAILWLVEQCKEYGCEKLE